MRTTIDIPEPLLAHLRSVSRETGRSLSAVVVGLIDQMMEPTFDARIVKGKSGFPAFAAAGQVITTDDVRALDDEE